MKHSIFLTKIKKGTFSVPSFEMEAPQFDPQKAQTKGKIFILDKDITNDGRVNLRYLLYHHLLCLCQE